MLCPRQFPKGPLRPFTDDGTIVASLDVRHRMSRLSRIAASVAVVTGVIVGVPYRGPFMFAETRSWVDQAYAPGPADNPLKGFVPYRGTYEAFPYSMEFLNIPWTDLQADFDRFTWGPLDTALEDIASRGHQLIVRIYADYPDAPYALPAFLSDVPKRSYTDFANGTRATSYAPDYDDPRLVRAMANTIRALGERYDGDPRVAFVQVGFLGFWGEWHTYRSSCECDTWMPTYATQSAVLNAFVGAFHHTKIVVRNPDVGWAGQAIGFHDDSFAEQTLDPPRWMFAGRLKTATATKQWRTQSIGGELLPTRQSCAFAAHSCTAQSYDESVDVTHASWLINHYAFHPGYAADEYPRALAGARRLGYDLFVSAANLPDLMTTDPLAVSVKMQNRGVAPFPYDWTVQLGVMDRSHRIVAVYDTSWRLTSVIDPRVEVHFSYENRAHGLAAGEYTMLMRAVTPLTGGKPLVFANAAWGRDAPDWLTLGTFSVREK